MWRLTRPARIMTCDETVTLIREAPISWVDGVPMPVGDALQMALICNVQPLNTGDLMLLPEGERVVEQFWLYVPEGQPTYPQENDYVMRNEQLYHVQDVRDWLSFQKVRMTRVDTGSKASINLPIVATR